jgi:hypothetical protein
VNVVAISTTRCISIRVRKQCKNSHRGRKRLMGSTCR